MTHPLAGRAIAAIRRPLRLAPVALLAAWLGCFSEAPDTTGPPDGEVAATVQMMPSLQFGPATVTIKAGQAVRWHNASGFSHTATADPGLAANPADVQLPTGAQAFNSGELTAGSDYVHTFTVPGEYHYFCIPHETSGMVGTVIVQP